MAYVPLTSFLVRAPLLPLAALNRPDAGFWEKPLPGAALALASPDLAAALTEAHADRARAHVALDRYRRRATFRPTPHGLWAGVAVGALGGRMQIDTGEPTPLFRVTWKRLADLGWALLRDPTVRVRVRLRRAPSVIVGADTVLWLGGGGSGGRTDASRSDDRFVEEKRAELDELLAAILAATAEWSSWTAVREAVSGDDGRAIGAEDDPEPEFDGAAEAEAPFEREVDEGEDESESGDEIDELLLRLVDDRLLHFDLVPPLVGPEPQEWMQQRLSEGRMALVPAARRAAAQLRAAAEAGRDGELERMRQALARMPGSDRAAPGVDATLLFHPPRPLTLPRNGVERAAALAPLLFRLQEALAPPASERTPQAALADALDAATEIFGAGALDAGALALGDYGVSVANDAEPDPRLAAELEAQQSPAALAPPPAVLGLLVNRMVDAARRGRPEVLLDAAELEALLPETALPATCEIFLTPGRVRAGHPAGDGWLVGLHAPAGASWGRFAFALGDEAATLFEPLRAAEEQARPGETRLDVEFTPSDRLGDICAHPPLRGAVLAVTGWPAADLPVVTLSQLDLCADPAALEPLALRVRPEVGSGGTGRAPGDGAPSRRMPVAPSALHRVRSSTAPAGIWRLLVGWSLYRQHAPWAVTLGPLGALDWTPRIRIDGFVVAPASWRIPRDLVEGAAPPASAPLRAWRHKAGVPRFVQVGTEDELLPVDLDAPGAAADLAKQQRVFEIWPPLGDSPDRAGRRVEAVVALADRPHGEEGSGAGAAIAGVRAAGAVPPPRQLLARQRLDGAPATDGWHTFKLFGASDRQDSVVVYAIGPAVEEALEAGEIDSWFFLRYVDGPGRRPHLRLRVHVPSGVEADTTRKRNGNENGNRKRRPTRNRKRKEKAQAQAQWQGEHDPNADGCGDGGADAARFWLRLQRHLQGARMAGDVVTIENASYFPELARFGGGAATDPGAAVAVLAAVHALFQADSEVACALLAMEAEGAGDEEVAAAELDAPQGRLVGLILIFDSLAAALGLAPRQRKELARRRLEAHASELDLEATRELGRRFRSLGPRLRAALGGVLPGAIRAAMQTYSSQVRRAATPLDSDARARLLPPLLHLSAVRLVGLERSAEISAYDFWARTLESLERMPAGGSRPGGKPPSSG